MGKESPDLLNGLTKNFYESEKKSKEIRSLCIEILSVLEFLLEQQNPTNRSFLKHFSTLEHYEISLKEMSIVENMHEDLDEKIIFTNPKKATEYIAGVVLGMVISLTKDISSAEVRLKTIPDFKQNVTIVDTDNLSKSSMKKIIEIRRCEKLFMLLNASDNEKTIIR